MWGVFNAKERYFVSLLSHTDIANWILMLIAWSTLQNEWQDIIAKAGLCISHVYVLRANVSVIECELAWTIYLGFVVLYITSLYLIPYFHHRILHHIFVRFVLAQYLHLWILSRHYLIKGMVPHCLIGENFGRITETSPPNEISLNSASISTQIFDTYTRNLCWISKVSIRASEIAGGGLIYRIFDTICVTFILREFSTKSSNFQYIYIDHHRRHHVAIHRATFFGIVIY